MQLPYFIELLFRFPIVFVPAFQNKGHAFLVSRTADANVSHDPFDDDVEAKGVGRNGPFPIVRCRPLLKAAF